MKTIKFTDNQIDVLQEALIFMYTEWASAVEEMQNDAYSDYWTEERKKEMLKQYRVAKNILPKLGLNKKNI